MTGNPFVPRRHTPGAVSTLAPCPASYSPHKFVVKRTPPTMPCSEPELVPIGYLSRAHGIRGELAFVLTAESPDLAEGEVWLRPRAGGLARPFAIEGSRSHHGGLLVRLRGVDTRNEAELLKAHTVLVDAKRLPELEDDEVWLRELPGLRVIVEDEKGAWELGVITAADAPAGQILWSIATPDGKEVLFPAVEEFVLSIDLERGETRIAPPPGLLDLYL